MRFPTLLRSVLSVLALVPSLGFAEGGVNLNTANLYQGWESVLSDMVGNEYRGTAQKPVMLGGPTLQLTIKVVSPRRLLMTETYLHPETGQVQAQGKQRVLELDGNLANAPVAMYDNTDGSHKFEALCHGISCHGAPSAPAPAGGPGYGGTQRTKQTMIFHPEEIFIGMILEGILSGELPPPLKNGQPLSGPGGQPLRNSIAMGSEKIRLDMMDIGQLVLKKVNGASNPAAVSGSLSKSSDVLAPVGTIGGAIVEAAPAAASTPR